MPLQDVTHLLQLKPNSRIETIEQHLSNNKDRPLLHDATSNENHTDTESTTPELHRALAKPSLTVKRKRSLLARTQSSKINKGNASRTTKLSSHASTITSAISATTSASADSFFRLFPTLSRTNSKKSKEIESENIDPNDADDRASRRDRRDRRVSCSSKSSASHMVIKSPRSTRDSVPIVEMLPTLPNPPYYGKSILERLPHTFNIHDALRRRQLAPFRHKPFWGVSPRLLVKDFVSGQDDLYEFENDQFDGGLTPPFSCAFNNVALGGHLLATSDEEGNIRILDTTHDRSNVSHRNAKTSWRAHQNAVFEVMWGPDDKTIISGSGDQSVKLWDVETQKCLAMFCGHSCSIKSVTYNSQDPQIIASAARDGNILIWDVRCTGVAASQGEYVHRPADSIRQAHSSQPSEAPFRKRRKKVGSMIPPRNAASQSVTAVRFLKHRPHLLASAGAANGVIKYWDARSHGSHAFKDLPLPVQISTVPDTEKRPHGISSLSLDSRGARLYAASSDNCVYTYDAANLGSPLRRLSGPTYNCSSFYIRTSVSPDDRFVASGSTDKGLHIWQVDAPGVTAANTPIVLKGHTSEVSGVSWSRTVFEKLATCSDDYSVRIWNANRQRAAEISRERKEAEAAEAIGPQPADRPPSP